MQCVETRSTNIALIITNDIQEGFITALVNIWIFNLSPPRRTFSSFFFQEQNIELKEKVKILTESEEDQQRALRALEQASVKMETEKIKQHTEAVRLLLI